MIEKYIIKNCPAIYKKIRINENNAVYIDEYRCNYQILNPCQDCTDCIMKQIVELCKDKMDTEFNSGSIFAEEILNLLQIEEVE